MRLSCHVPVVSCEGKCSGMRVGNCNQTRSAGASDGADVLERRRYRHTPEIVTPHAVQMQSLLPACKCGNGITACKVTVTRDLCPIAAGRTCRNRRPTHAGRLRRNPNRDFLHEDECHRTLGPNPERSMRSPLGDLLYQSWHLYQALTMPRANSIRFFPSCLPVSPLRTERWSRRM